MGNNVQFEEDRMVSSMPKPRSVTLAGMIVKTGIVRKPRDAELLLGLLAVVMIFASYYFFKIALPPEHTLGHDILMPGEAVPSYVNQNATQQ